jgi:hypothetical protein
MIHRAAISLWVRGGNKRQNLAEPVYVQRSVWFQYSSNIPDPFVAPKQDNHSFFFAYRRQS